MAKSKQKDTLKIVGIIDEKYVKNTDAIEYANCQIVQSTKLDVHTNKHANEFFSIDSYYNTLANIDKIVQNPYYVEYDNIKRSLKYYGRVDQYVCVVVKLNKKSPYVSTLYPQSKNKIDSKKQN